MKTWPALLLCLALFGPSPAPAAPGAPADAALRERADRLAHGLRCMVCQNQTLAESNAPLARDMRRIIRDQLAQGRSDEEIMRFFQARYGDFVRYDPPFKPLTWLLWIGPFALLALGLAALWRAVARRPASRAPLTADERARAARYLDSGP
ncbi:cytochrome c-type biogenesis protein [Achromobacter sp. Marseille-Q4962]|uniref:cytochrome c-type biogenesis protein n=1 Tax=Achromobacter sp. Marseille-Q4962 TaxID=2942202 RepID=UPI002072F062|nr:cytochrome c-type biogenesis protein [Achromobacter sp. Marseille-Q4962]